MRLVFLALLILLAGCLEQQCPTYECPPPDCPQPEQINETQEECTAANITIVTLQVNQTCNQTMNETNITEPELPEQEIEGIPFANYLLVLDDVSYPTTSEDACGIFSIMHAGNLSVVDRLIICPGDSKSWVSPEGRIYRVLVKEVAAGYTKDTQWADVIIFG